MPPNQRDDRIAWVREELRGDIGDLRGDIARLYEQNARDHAEVTKRLDNYSQRIRALELWRSWIAGIAAAAGAVASWIMQIVRDGR